MKRRVLLVMVFLGLLTGCGMAMRKIQREEMVAMETVNRTFPESSHRVAVAAFEAMRADLASAELAKDSEFLRATNLTKPDGSRPSEAELPPNFPAFWVEWKADGRTTRDLLTLGACHFEGKTRRGRKVEVAVINQQEVTLVTVHVDHPGDKSESRALLEKITERLAHPTHPPGSPEEAAMFKAFFGGVESRDALPSLKKKAEDSH